MTRLALRKSLFILAVTVFAALMVAIAAQAQAQMACGTRDSVIEKLGEKYGEVRRGGGLAGPTAIFEIWASDKPPNSWTILKTTPNGWTCIMAVGDGWHDDTGELIPTGNPV